MKRTTSTLAAWVLTTALWGAFAGPAAGQELWMGGQTFTSKPKMNYIPNTDVYYQRKAPGYDLYRYADTWYVVDDGAWYESRSWQGPYAMIDVNDVPVDVMQIPGDYRRFWAKAPPVEDRSAPDGDQVWAGSFSRKPTMHNITSSGVSYARKAANGRIDLYRFAGNWYLVDNARWYRADSWRGPFFSISATTVPRAVLRVPSTYRRHWVESAGY